MAAPIIRDGLSPEQLREAVSYDPDTGLFTWLIDPKRGKRTKGKPAGHRIARDGYVVVKLAQRLYRAHRLAWLYMTGEWPVAEIDHINGDGFDNTWANLREATRTENLRNTRPHRDNSSGTKGVYFQKHGGRWIARIMADRRQHHLGTHDTIEEAAAAYREAAIRLHGAFARTE